VVRAILDLVCCKCGETITRTVEQFAQIPNCPRCGGEMLVESSTVDTPTLEIDENAIK
jgi:DNA-directed RNA polymerase subunit RPC12/RpoP